MRWLPKQKHKYGDLRIVRRFLWLPTCAGMQEPTEWRWLEWAWIQQQWIDCLVWSLPYYFVEGPNDFRGIYADQGIYT